MTALRQSVQSPLKYQSYNFLLEVKFFHYIHEKFNSIEAGIFVMYRMEDMSSKYVCITDGQPQV